MDLPVTKRAFSFPGLTIDVSAAPGEADPPVLVFRLKGEIGTQALEGFHRCMEDFLTAGFTRMVLDFSGIKFMGSGGFGALLLLKSKTTTRGGSLKVCRFPPYLQRVMSALGFERFFKPYASESEALDDPADVAAPGRD